MGEIAEMMIEGELDENGEMSRCERCMKPTFDCSCGACEWRMIDSDE